ncbi:hypothetical protein JSY17_14920 [Pseudomonas capsici]|uniref:hypothetical protein n=1 Tax=Pseudomonas capsici TaxID=2810614 RepID=UPI0019CF5712|nr:hypothetical protein [Pseudomonas capsici]MBN6715283.1 hypothetical protein [Pseudomonas capsici]MBN6720320.1 hypothetical protein [Pseudomonas capsici]MBN6725184.1 hypothetical protein [Pseudomonas capsici]
MNKDEQHDRQVFFDGIRNYPFIRPDGRLVLEPFGVYLSHCFGFDGILELSPQPIDVYRLLIDIIYQDLGNDNAQRYIQFQNIADWRPEDVYIYPEKKMTCIHIGGLVSVSHYWIYEIGHSLMGIPEPEEPGKYFAWAKEEWLAVYTFINGYHNALISFQKHFDQSNISQSGYSLFEALHLARAINIDFDEAVSQLKVRQQAQQAAMAQIAKAMKDGYYLEAITIEECLISNCLFNFLDGIGTRLPRPSFHKLLKTMANKQCSAHAYPTELLLKIDTWRCARNTAIHGFISSTTVEFDASHTHFQESAKITATAGEEYCKAIVSWYELECVNFVKHEFPSERKKTVY